jgi:hypothetical protein
MRPKLLTLPNFRRSVSRTHRRAAHAPCTIALAPSLSPGPVQRVTIDPEHVLPG